MRHLFFATFVAGSLLTLTIACSSDSGDDHTHNDATDAIGLPGSNGEHHGANEVHLYMTEYEITGEDGAAIPQPVAGEVTFEVHNEGAIQHEFVVIKTDLNEGELPVDGTTVDENATGVDIVDEIEPFDADTAEILTVDLAPGAYVLICNIAGHYELDMHAAMTVE